MYQIVLIHEVLPGKLPEMKTWFKEADERRASQNPDYRPPRRFITVFGSVHQFVAMFEMEKVPEEPLVYAEMAPEGEQGEFLKLIVPGRTEIHVLKELELDS